MRGPAAQPAGGGITEMDEMEKIKDIRDIRQAIDETDEELTKLLVQRLGLSGMVAEYKKDRGAAVQDGLREREVLRQVAERSGEEYSKYTRIIYDTILDTSKAYQYSLMPAAGDLTGAIEEAVKSTPELFPESAVVACQGIPGAHSEAAALKMIPGAQLMYFSSFESVFSAVESGMCRYGVLPIENSNFGSIGEVYDMMREHKFSIVRSTKHLVNQKLLAKPGVKLEEVKEIFSHEQALGQCSRFLAGLEGVKVTASSNTAAAAKAVSESDRRDIAAISSEECASLYGLEVIAGDIQVNNNNYTRFICISKDMQIYPGDTKISLMLRVPHRPMSLYHTIGKISTLGINICKLESRPFPGSDFEFTFYFDLDASIRDPKVARALAELAAELDFFVFLGAYQEV